MKWSAFYVVGAGTSTSLALSFFKHSNESNNDLDKNLMLMREADLLYDTYLIDNAYNILRKFVVFYIIFVVIKNWLAYLRTLYW